MAKKQDSTVENRVYLFADLASAFLATQGGALIGSDAQRDKALRALGDIAHAACVMADHGGAEGRRVGDMVARGHGHNAPAVAPKTKTAAAAPKPKAKATKKAARKVETPKRATKKAKPAKKRAKKK